MSCFHIFSVQTKSGACYITGQWGEQNKINLTLALTLNLLLFIMIKFVFFIMIFTAYLRPIFYEEEMSVRLHERLPFIKEII